MIDKIINMYEAQFRLYDEAFEFLNDAERKSYSDYKAVLNKVEEIFEKIHILNEELNAAKDEYLKIKGIPCFIGREIYRVEEKEKYLELKKVIEAVREKIKITKKLQDNFIANINKQNIEGSKVSNNGLDIYIKKIKEKDSLQKNTYFDKTK